MKLPTFRRTLRKERTRKRLNAHAVLDFSTCQLDQLDEKQKQNKKQNQEHEQEQEKKETFHAQVRKRINGLAISVPPRVGVAKKKKNKNPPPFEQPVPVRETLDWNIVLPDTQEDDQDFKTIAETETLVQFQTESQKQQKQNHLSIFSLPSSFVPSSFHHEVCSLSLGEDVDFSFDIKKKKKEELSNQTQHKIKTNCNAAAAAAIHTSNLYSTAAELLPKSKTIDSPPLFALKPSLRSSFNYPKKKVRFQLETFETFQNEESSTSNSVSSCLNSSFPEIEARKKKRCLVKEEEKLHTNKKRKYEKASLILIVYKESCTTIPLFVEEEELQAIGLTREFFESRGFRITFSERNELLSEKIQLRQLLSKKMKEVYQTERCYEKLLVQNRHLLFSCVCSLE